MSEPFATVKDGTQVAGVAPSVNRSDFMNLNGEWRINIVINNLERSADKFFSVAIL
jgi:hypothetical protein